MTDEPDDPRGATPGPSSGAGGAEGPEDADRPGLVAGEAAAIARFGDGPALFSADVPAPRHPHVGPLLPQRRLAFRAGNGREEAARATGTDPSSGTELVLAPRRLPARPEEDLAGRWRRAGIAARRGVAVAVDWTARGVVAAVTVLGAAANAVVGLIFGPERPALPEGRR
ncbi:hypothetical protein [Actinomycetospora sp. NBRC 106378]|uniref:hypothetical protein n=1 Tax=Actinomycetospora sp. NBRC 106378 TaxID=3032208 RepID=UPI00249F9D45|nr:hypothetical protein [Actinomycetospora sp. NBRC 106378]GLZ52807.1 hypothetical protein Acsp07_24240 [Actinomycetospora sp. NBRC 106378]